MVENGQDHRRRYGIREVSARLVSFSSAQEAGAKDICIHQGIVNPHLCYLCPRYGGGRHDSFELSSSRFPEVTWAKRGENKLGTKGEHGQHSKTNPPAMEAMPMLAAGKRLLKSFWLLCMYHILAMSLCIASHDGWMVASTGPNSRDFCTQQPNHLNPALACRSSTVGSRHRCTIVKAATSSIPFPYHWPHDSILGCCSPQQYPDRAPTIGLL